MDLLVLKRKNKRDENKKNIYCFIDTTLYGLPKK